jgi:hypothetical protein
MNPIAAVINTPIFKAALGTTLATGFVVAAAKGLQAAADDPNSGAAYAFGGLLGHGAAHRAQEGVRNFIANPEQAVRDAANANSGLFGAAFKPFG